MNYIELLLLQVTLVPRKTGVSDHVYVEPTDNRTVIVISSPMITLDYYQIGFIPAEPEKNSLDLQKAVRFFGNFAAPTLRHHAESAPTAALCVKNASCQSQQLSSMNPGRRNYRLIQ